MPTSELYGPNAGNTRWNSRGTAGQKGLGKGIDAERKVYVNYAGGLAVALIEQDAFPCGDCDIYFLQQSSSKGIVFRVTADGTGDRNYHIGKGLPDATGYPCLLYYLNGARSYDEEPEGWPAAPPL
jgi:hypothetical protein